MQNVGELAAKNYSHISQITRRWLFDTACNSSGFVAGRFDARQHAVYFYDEIAGYYLSFLANQSKFFPVGEIHQRISLVQTSLLHQWRTSGRQTRRYCVPPDAEDWRNDYVFSFDLAMLLRGVAACEQAGFRCSIDTSLIIEPFWGLRDEERGIVAATISGKIAEPLGWSTSTAAYQYKTLAGLKSYANVFAQPELLETCIKLESYLDQYFLNLDSLIVLPPHPALYALEGMLQVKGTTLSQSLILEGLDYITDSVLESLADPQTSNREFRRVDVASQLVRLRVITGMPLHETELLMHKLIAMVTSNGSLPFLLSTQSDGSSNTWAALFFEQACDMFLTCDLDVADAIERII